MRSPQVTCLPSSTTSCSHHLPHTTTHSKAFHLKKFLLTPHQPLTHPCRLKRQCPPVPPATPSEAVSHLLSSSGAEPQRVLLNRPAISRAWSLTTESGVAVFLSSFFERVEEYWLGGQRLRLRMGARTKLCDLKQVTSLLGLSILPLETVTAPRLSSPGRAPRAGGERAQWEQALLLCKPQLTPICKSRSSKMLLSASQWGYIFGFNVHLVTNT